MSTEPKSGHVITLNDLVSDNLADCETPQQAFSTAQGGITRTMGMEQQPTV